MTLKKRTYGDDEIPIFDDAMIYKRGDYWQFRMWLAGEGKYAIKSLKTRNRSTAIDKGKDFYLELLANQRAGKKYFSLTTKEGVAKYIARRQKDVDSGDIVVGRLGTIKIHLEHWLDFIGRDTKLKELERTDCDEYFNQRRKPTKSKRPVSPSTLLNEKTTINAMMSWLFKQNETYIDQFEFPKLKRQDAGDDRIRRSTFTVDEVQSFGLAIGNYWNQQKNKLDHDEWKARTLACYYFLVAALTGLRTGEQRQLMWRDVSFSDVAVGEGEVVQLVKIKVRSETSKVRQSRNFMVRDIAGHFVDLKMFAAEFCNAKIETGNSLMFSLDGKNPISERFILYHFGKLIELAEIDTTDRDIVPYSFRHFFITQKLVNGLNHRQVADMCGTSISQIEKTYYHVDEDILHQNALADHGTGNEGIVVWTIANK